MQEHDDLKADFQKLKQTNDKLTKDNLEKQT